MAQPFNAYGMPNGNYAQPTKSRTSVQPTKKLLDQNPIAIGLDQPGSPNTGAPPDGLAPDTGTPVTAMGQPNLALQAALNQAHTSPLAGAMGAAFPGSGGIGAAASTGYGGGLIDKVSQAGYKPPSFGSDPNGLPGGQPPPVVGNAPAVQAALAPPTIHGRYKNGDSDVADAQTILGNAYHQFLHRDASPQEIQSMLTTQGLRPGDKYVGETGLNGLLQNIYHSPEAGGQATSPTGTPAAPSTPAGGGDNIDQLLAQYAATPGANPSVRNDPGYWRKRITETGGLRADNTDYWGKLMMRPEGAPEGGGSTALQGALGSSNNFSQQYLAQLMQQLATQNALK